MGEAQFSVFQDERFMDLTLYQFGYEKCQPLHSFGPYVRNHYLFHYVLSGRGTLYADHPDHTQSDKYHIKGGSGFLIEPDLSNMYAADEKDPWEYVWVEFGGLRAKECMEAAGLSWKTPVFHPDTAAHGREVADRMMAIVHRQNISSLGQIGNLYLFADCLLRYSTSRRQLQEGNISAFYAREALSYIETNYARDITVSDMARHCQLDRSYFGKIFKKEIGRSPQEFLIQYRMAKAVDLLTMSNRSIKEISGSVGYENQLHFSRAFKNVYGVSPRKYREKHRII